MKRRGRLRRHAYYNLFFEYDLGFNNRMDYFEPLFFELPHKKVSIRGDRENKDRRHDEWKLKIGDIKTKTKIEPSKRKKIEK